MAGAKLLPDLHTIGCMAEPEHLRAQQERGESLRAQLASARRAGDRVELLFSPGVDERLLQAFVKAEQECCLFFRFDWEPAERRLGIEVPPAHRPALDAVAELLGA